MKFNTKMFVAFAVVFFVGFGAGILTEHIVHGIQAKKSLKTSTEKHDGRSNHCADGHADSACLGL